MNTKRKVKDYIGQNVAIYCSSKEEWDKIVDLFPSDRSIKKTYWQNSVNNGKSDTINIDGYGWSPKKHYEDEGYTIYPASDFLGEIKSISEKDLKEGEIYLGKWAEIVSDEPEINTYGLKVGDILKKEIINTWASIRR